MGRRIATPHVDNLPDADTTLIVYGDEPLLAMAVGPTSEIGSYIVRPSNFRDNPFIVDNRHPFIGESPLLRMIPPIEITPNWNLINTAGDARGAAIDLMLYADRPYWLPRGRAVVDSVTKEGEKDLQRKIICQGRDRVVCMVKNISGIPGTVRYVWTSFDRQVPIVGQYAFSEPIAGGGTTIHTVMSTSACCCCDNKGGDDGDEGGDGGGDNSVITAADPITDHASCTPGCTDGLADMLTVFVEDSHHTKIPCLFVLEGYDD